MKQEAQEAKILLNNSNYFPNFDRTPFTTSKSRQTIQQDMKPKILIHPMLKTPSTYYQEKSTTCSSTKHHTITSRKLSEGKSIIGIKGVLSFETPEQKSRKSQWQKLVSIGKKKFSLEPYIYTHDLGKLLNLPKSNIEKGFLTQRKMSAQREDSKALFTLKPTIMDKRKQKRAFNFELSKQFKIPQGSASKNQIPQVAATIIKNYQAQQKYNKKLFQRLDEIAHPQKYKTRPLEEPLSQPENLKIYKQDLRAVDKELLRQELAKIHSNIYLRQRLQDKDLKQNYRKLGMVSSWSEYIHDLMSEKRKVLLKLNSAVSQKQRDYIRKLFKKAYDPANQEESKNNFLQQYFTADMYEFVSSVY